MKFNKDGVTRGNIYHVPLTGFFLLESIGYYQVSIKIYHTYASQLGLFMNGNLIAGSVTGEPAVSVNLTIITIIDIDIEDLLLNSDSATGVAAILEVRNHSSYINPLVLDGREGSGSDLTQINASINIVQLSDEQLV